MMVMGGSSMPKADYDLMAIMYSGVTFTNIFWCYINKYVPVNFLRISNENVKYKLVKSPYLLSVSWTAVKMYTKMAVY